MIYAIHRRTKEHRIADEHAWGHGAYKLIDADADGWIEWPGGECPLPDGSRCDVKHKDGEVYIDTSPGGPGAVRWAHKDLHGDIIAYRPILSNESEPEPCRFHDDDTEACETYSGQAPCEPEPPAWDGESWPPPERGRVEVKRRNNDEFLAGTVAAVGRQGGDTRIAVKTDCGDLLTYKGSHGAFGLMVRPVRSEEDEAIHAMRAQDCEPFEGMMRRHDFCRAIYAAIREGRIPGVILEES